MKSVPSVKSFYELSKVFGWKIISAMAIKLIDSKYILNNQIIGYIDGKRLRRTAHNCEQHKILKSLGKKFKDIFRKSPDSERDRKAYARKYAKKTKEAFDSGTKKMGKEARETQEMAASFYKLLEHKLNLNNRTEPPSEEEVKEAVVEEVVEEETDINQEEETDDAAA